MTPTNRDGSTSTDSTRPLALSLYVVGAVSLGLSALYGGAVLMLNRENDPLGLPLEWLDDTPFTDYFLPGFTLFSVFGVGSFVVLFGIVGRRSWAWIAAVALGVSQVVWIAAQVFFLRRVHVLHVVYGGLGALLGALAATPSVRAYLSGRD